MARDLRDLYRVLQVSPDAEPEVIDAAYRQLAKRYHPDVNPSPDAASRMREINAAYEILSDPVRRQAYERQAAWPLPAPGGRGVSIKFGCSPAVGLLLLAIVVGGFAWKVVADRSSAAPPISAPLAPSSSAIREPVADSFATAGSDRAQQLPAGIRLLIPAGRSIKDAFRADLNGSGQEQWVVLSETPQALGPVDAHLTIFAPRQPLPTATGEAWINVGELDAEAVLAPELRLVALPGVPGIGVRAAVGDRASSLAIFRWDGQTFRRVFVHQSNTPNLDVEDLDGDGAPEVVDYWSPSCETYELSPRLLTVWRWNGGQYVEATPQYQIALREAEQRVRVALDASGGWTASGRACLHWSLGRLAELSRDTQRAAAEYRLAAEIDPTWRPPG